MNESAFVAAVLADPGDDAPRLVYADWLDEQGRGEQAEFIRIGCRLAQVHEPHVCGFNHGHRGCWVCALRRREEELAHIGWREWTAGLPGNRAVSWTASGLEFGVAQSPSKLHYLFRRGFVHAITLSWDDCRTHLDAVRRVAPIERVTLTTWPDLCGSADMRREYGVTATTRMLENRWHGIAFTLPPAFRPVAEALRRIGELGGLPRTPHAPGHGLRPRPANPLSVPPHAPARR